MSKVESARFRPEALKFLKGLGRNNDRDWFNERKDVYERELKEPLLAVIAAVTAEMEGFAPEFVRPPAKCMMRIYRDIRFSKNKAPYKTNVAAWWAKQGMEKTSGGGFYLQVSATGVLVAAGVYAPEKEQLLQIRRMLVERHAEYAAALAARPLKTLLTPFDGMPMTRVPKGFAADDPAAELIKQRQWGVSAELGVELAMDAKLVPEIVRRFKAANPLVTLLNSALAPRVKKALF